MKNKQKTRRLVLSALASLRFGLILLLIIVVAGVCATLIPQGEPLNFYRENYGPGLGGILHFTQLTKVFGSSWFAITALLLLVNLAACTYSRLSPGGNWRKYGSTLLHLGLMIIIIGSLVSSFLGRSDYFQAPVQSVLAMTDKGYPFDLRVDNFEIDYYEPKGESQEQQHGQNKQPKQYRTELTVMENNKPVNTREIKVNQPLSFRGTKIYQSSYGWLVEGVLEDNGRQTKFNAPAGRPVALNDSYIMEALPSVDGQVLYRLSDAGQPILVGKAGMKETIDLPCGKVQFTSLRQYTGLQVKQDPGLPLVWSGFALLTAGVILKLYGPKVKEGK